ncbi:hypothetical protein QC760_001201 [Botrytis cinerea]
MSMAGIEITGAISAVAGLLESSINLLDRLVNTCYDRKNPPKILGTHVAEIQRILNILELVKHEADLRTTAVISEIETIRKIATELISNLQVMISGGKSQKPLQGTKEQEALTKLMARLERAKSNLGMGLNAAHGEVTRLVGEKINVLNRVDELLRNAFGDDGRLRDADVVINYHSQKNGLVHVKNGALSATKKDGDVVLGNVEEGGQVSSRIVLNNVVREQALQINGPVGEKGWREAFQLEVRDNQAAGNSIQVNHAISEDMFNKLLAHKNQNK